MILQRFLNLPHVLPTMRNISSSLFGSRSVSVSSILAIKASDLTKENLPPRMSNGCPICSRGITFSYKDVLFLSQFMMPDGKMLNRRVTGVCKRQQKVLQKKINVARRLGIIPNYTKIKDEIGMDS